MMVLFGVHAAMWGTLMTSIRQAAVPIEYQGRVSSVYHLVSQGGLVIGAGIGALIAGVFGVVAVYWFAFVGSALILVLNWKRFGNLAVLAPEEQATGE